MRVYPSDRFSKTFYLHNGEKTINHLKSGTRTLHENTERVTIITTAKCLFRANNFVILYSHVASPLSQYLSVVRSHIGLRLNNGQINFSGRSNNNQWPEAFRTVVVRFERKLLRVEKQQNRKKKKKNTVI